MDLGCGDGLFLADCAALNPERNFLGIERLVGRVEKASRRAERLGSSNVRILRIENAYAVRHVLPPESVSVFHLSFPDPWPKRRHHRRRLVTPEFLALIHTALTPSGELRLTTDDLSYFEQMKAAAVACPTFMEQPWTPGSDYPRTRFEQRFLAQALPIYRLLLRKT